MCVGGWGGGVGNIILGAGRGGYSYTSLHRYKKYRVFKRKKVDLLKKIAVTPLFIKEAFLFLILYGSKMIFLYSSEDSL